MTRSDARKRLAEDRFDQCPHEVIRATCGQPCGCDCAGCKRLVPPTGPHAPALSEADREALIDWWDSDWPDTKGGALGTLYAAVERITAARRPADKGGLRADIEALVNEPDDEQEWEHPDGNSWRRVQVIDSERIHAVLARHPAEPSTPAPEATVVEEWGVRYGDGEIEAADEWLGSVSVSQALEAALHEHITHVETDGPDGPYIWCTCLWRSDDTGSDNPGLSAITHMLNVLHAATMEPIRQRLRDRADRLAAPEGNPGSHEGQGEG